MDGVISEREELAMRGRNSVEVQGEGRTRRHNQKGERSKSLKRKIELLGTGQQCTNRLQRRKFVD